MNTILFATDLDGTLVGDDVALAACNKVLSRLRGAGQIKIAYVTGRSWESFRQLRDQQNLLAPDALITAVGSEIYTGSILEHDTNWPVNVIWDITAVHNALAGVPDLVVQPKPEQRPYKLSYFLDNSQSALDIIKERLKTYPVDIIYSGQKYLDIMPHGINKGSALAYLATKFEILPENIIAFGDSANDIAMLASNKAVVTGNAQQELLDWADQTTTKDTYISSASYAAGIIEGLIHYDVIA